VDNLKSAKARIGKRPEANCWGLTAFLLGWRCRLTFMSDKLMEARLRTRTERIQKPKRFRIGDVAASWDKDWEGHCPRGIVELLHTAVYVGRGEWLHQTGYRGEVRLATFKQMIRSYPGRTTYYRAHSQ
jgi:hypothetical protein